MEDEEWERAIAAAPMPEELRRALDESVVRAKRAAGWVLEDEAQAVMRAAAKWLGVAEDQFFVADHHHNETRPGTWTVACEGWNGETPWPYLFTAAVNGTLREASSTPPVLPDGILLDCFSSWAITVYRERS